MVKCRYCDHEFERRSSNHVFCSTKCSRQARTDSSYFNGNRRNTLGLVQGICQLCRNQPKKGLSSHHLLGRRNDEAGEYLVALCSGCHALVTMISVRNFVWNEKAWKRLWFLAVTRKRGSLDGITDWRNRFVEEGSAGEQGQAPAGSIWD